VISALDLARVLLMPAALYSITAKLRAVSAEEQPCF